MRQLLSMGAVVVVLALSACDSAVDPSVNTGGKTDPAADNTGNATERGRDELERFLQERGYRIERKRRYLM